MMDTESETDTIPDGDTLSPDDDDHNESGDENQNLLVRRRGSAEAAKSYLPVPDARPRSNSSPLTPNIVITLTEACGSVRRLSDSSRISYKTFDWDSASLSTHEAKETRVESILQASTSMTRIKSEESELSVQEVREYIEEIRQEYEETHAAPPSANNSAQTTKSTTAEERRLLYMRMTSLTSDPMIEKEVKVRMAVWSEEETDKPAYNNNRNSGGIPYTALHDAPVSYQAKSRRVFMANTPVYIKIADCGRVHSTLHLNPNLYYVEIQHGPCIWTVRRRYNHFLRLHDDLVFYKAKLHIPVGKQSHRERYQAYRQLSDDINDLPHFPRTLDALVRSHQLAKRMLQLEKYLQGVVNHPLYRNHPKMLEFLEVSHMSFIDEIGQKGKEGWVLKRSGGHRVQLGCCSCLSCNIKAHYSKRWLMMKDSFVAYVRPSDGLLRAVLLMDQEFRAACGRSETGLAHGLKITNTYRNLLLKLNHKAVAQEWKNEICQRAQNCEYTFDNVHGSFAPPREATFVQGFADGADYFESIADAMEAAEQQILILDWCLNPEIYMKRPALQENRWRLDHILKRKAEQGVKVFVLLYKEVEVALDLGSQYTKRTLMELHPNIKLMRHPDHIPGGAGVVLWAHHEKAVIIDQHTAFLGGIDICFGRWDDFTHRLTDTGSQAPNGNPNASGQASLQHENTDGNVRGDGQILTAAERRRRQFGIVEGAARLWVGKDYCNFVQKDVTQPELPFQENVDRTKVPRMPWHDIGAVVYGKAACDVARHFIQRWNFTKEQKNKGMQTFPLLVPKSCSAISNVGSHVINPKATRCRCQILRSASDWSVGMNKTEDSIHQAYLQAINTSKHYIYIENQFFISVANDPDVSNGIADAIFERIVRAHRAGETFRVYVMMPLLPAFEGEVGGETGGPIHAVLYWEYRAICKGENSLLHRLYHEGITSPAEYIGFYALRNHGTLGGSLVTEQIYIHCKLMIVDDRTVIIGSANINDRSMLGGRDSELAVLVEDAEFVDGTMDGRPYQAGKFACRFRQLLFREHLGVLQGEGDIDVSDPVSDAFYNKTWTRIAYTNTSIYDEVFMCIPTNRATTFLELQEYRAETSLAESDPREARRKLNDITGHLVLIPMEFLSHEHLQPSITTSEGIAPTKLWT